MLMKVVNYGTLCYTNGCVIVCVLSMSIDFPLNIYFESEIWNISRGLTDLFHHHESKNHNYVFQQGTAFILN